MRSLNNARLLHLGIAVLLLGGFTGLISLPSRAIMQGVGLTLVRTNGIVLNGTDYNTTWTVHYTSELGSATEGVTARIIVEYGDFVSTRDISSGVPRFSISPRIAIEYADYASNQFAVESPATSLAPANRIVVEYADFASTAFGMRYAWDINDDHKVNMRDVGIAARLFGSAKGSSNWNMIADINGDGVINEKDIGAIARHYGESYT